MADFGLRAAIFLAFFEVLRQDKKGAGLGLRFFYESEPVLKDYESDLFLI